MSFWSILFTQWTLYAGIILYLLYKWSTAPYKFFAQQGIPFKEPSPLFGNFGAMTLRTKTMHDMIREYYEEFKGNRYFGIFDFRRPLLVIRDPELIKQITVKDFEHFLDHRSFLIDTERDPLFGKSLFLLTGQKWRDMRATLSPAFTGSKMRQMFQLVVDCAEAATQIMLKDCSETNKPYVPEMKDLFTRFTNDVIATSAFGIQVNSLKNRNNEFYEMGKKSTSFTGTKLIIKLTIMSLVPALARILKLKFFDDDLQEFYSKLVHGTIRHREQHNIIRPDMINLLMEARKGSLRNETEHDTEGFATVEEMSNAQLKGGQKRVWDDDDLTAQCFLFFLAGFDTSATLLCFAAHELTENRDIQDKLLEEIDDVRMQLNGKPLNYDILQKMKYMDMVVSETLRKWPPATAIDRRCNKKYEIVEPNGKKIVINEGEGIWIPIYGIHRNPEYYPDPDKFDPERFNDDNKNRIQPFTYLPFGSGPRNCIGSRFALMESKAFLFYLLSNFTFEVAETTQIPLKLAKAGFSVKAEKGFNIHLKPRN